MLTPTDSSHVMWWKWSVVILLLTALIYDVNSTSDLASTVRVRKCSCNKYQGWDGTTCHDTSAVLPIYDKNLDLQQDEINVNKYGTGIYIHTVENVTVMDLECPKDLFSALIKDNIFLLPDGRLLWLDAKKVFTNDVFCIEFFVDYESVFFDAHVCLPPPAVPRCCPADHLLDRDGSCHPHEALQAPPLQLGEHMLAWDRVSGDMVSLTCSEHEYFRQINLRPTEGQLVDTQPTASLLWRPPFWVAATTWNSRYCVALQETETGELQYVARICFKDYDRYHQHQCNNSLCIRKCCPENQVLARKWCLDSTRDEEMWRPPQNISDEWKIVFGEPGCKASSHFGEMHILPNGSLRLTPESVPVPPSRYCVDNHLYDDGSVGKFALTCFPPVDTGCLWRDIVVKVMMGLSCVFLVATLAVYLGVAELRDHTYGRCLISMVTAMLTAYICLITGLDSSNSKASCYTQAFFNQLSALAMFFWLNVMCFDMWKILRGSSVQHHSKRVFLKYSLYAWGCPTVVSIVTLILEIMAPQNIILPGIYSGGKCWFSGDRAYWVYFYDFILVLVLVNIVFFVHVAVTLYKKMKQRTQTFETGASRTNKITKTKHQLWLFAKLFVVMGVLWIVDVLSVVHHRKTCSYWVFSDIINGLQGVFIFIVAVCNKDNLKKIKDAWRPRVQVMHKTFSSLQGQTSRRTTQNTLSIDDTEASRKTSITSLPRKISQASNIFFPGSSKKTATLNPADSSGDSSSGRKSSNVSIKDIIPLSSMKE